ncbi:CotY/CotZ family spore coat protein [Bacillus sp. 31A1R]|uniref:CotY/CotZ family spore coat protein n=1 Tax=Robertmurraya mangrovi TaxID=3098077 RepID=A0ABU5J0Q2_9BACI|nr:CotY/CotZ family spore coat protein [Bacillus sp. 31A1R]MDZ5472998.1 CotY/CotZ family spore coat protein [Bacillus sp. 31A1R]
MDTTRNDSSKDCLIEALLELKALQDFISNSSTKYFGKLLPKLIGADTIPFFLSTKEGLLTLTGDDFNKKTGKSTCFSTKYFRIESILKESGCVIVSLLMPLDIHGEHTKNICDCIQLKKTSTCVTIDFSCICAIQPLELELLKRKIIVEPKW